MVSSSSFATTSLVQRTSWDPERDFDAIALLARAPFVGIVHPDLPVRDWRGLAGLAKAKPGTINYGSSGAGGTNHFVTEYFSQAAGVEMNHVPYRGTAPAVLDLIAGRIQLMITTVASASAAMREGRVRVIGMADEGGGLPEGVAEPATARAQGFDFEASIWWGLIGPKGLPAEIRAAIHAAANLALADPALVRIYAAEGARPQQGGPDAFAQLLRSDLVRFREVARRANIRPE
jgi:tripartite-type tricarboxylate transporter receptor subunit TctC